MCSITFNFINIATGNVNYNTLLDFYKQISGKPVSKSQLSAIVLQPVFDLRPLNHAVINCGWLKMFVLSVFFCFFDRFSHVWLIAVADSEKCQ